MTDAEFEDLLARSLEGTLAEDGERRLWEEVLSNESRRARLMEERDLHEDLRRLLTPGATPPAFVQGVLSELSDQRKDNRKFARSVAARVARRRRVRRTSGVHPGWWMAAAALVAVTLIVIFTVKERPKPRPDVAGTDVPPPPPERVPDPEPPPVKTPPAPERPPVPEPTPPVPPTPPTPNLEPPTVPVPRPEPTPPTPPPKEPAPPPEPKKPDTPRPAPRTRVAVAVVEALRGDVRRISGGGREPLAAGRPIRSDEGLETAEGGGLAVLRFPDSTRVWLGPGTRISGISDKAVLRLDAGLLTAEVARRPADRPFVIATKRAEARVLGTILRVSVDERSTRLEVEEGKVRLTPPDKRGVDVSAGRFAVAAEGTRLRARTLPRNVLLDPGFERGAKPWRLWTPEGKPLEGRAVKPGEGRAKSNGLRIDAVERWEHPVWQEIAIAPGAEYVASAWVRCDALRAAGRMVLHWLRAPGRGDELRPEEIVRSDVVGSVDETLDWAPLRIRTAAPPGARGVRVVLMTMPGTGTLWTDDVSLVRSEK